MTAITATGLVVGTAAYLAPEQVTGAGAEPASDVYALGLVLLEALTGERAFAGSASESALARLQRAPEVPQTATRSLAPLLTAMTAADPTLRPSASAVASRLTAGAEGAPADSTAVLPIASDVTIALPIASPPVRQLDARRLRVPLIAAAVIALLILLSSAFGGGGGLTAPATAETPTTAAPATTAAPVTAIVQPVPATSPPATRHGKKDHEGG